MNITFRSTGFKGIKTSELQNVLRYYRQKTSVSSKIQGAERLVARDNALNYMNEQLRPLLGIKRVLTENQKIQKQAAMIRLNELLYGFENLRLEDVAGLR